MKIKKGVIIFFISIAFCILLSSSKVNATYWECEDNDNARQAQYITVNQDVYGNANNNENSARI